MARPASILAVAMVALCFSGCGTFSDAMCGPIDPNPFYRGVRFDIAMVQKGGGDAVIGLADIPFSAVADTVVLPVIGGFELTYLAWERSHPDSEKQAAEEQLEPSKDGNAVPGPGPRNIEK